MKVIWLLLSIVIWWQGCCGSDDIHPSKIALIVREKEVIEGSRFHLECHVYGARPAANISWHNFTKQFDNSDKNTRISSKALPNNDGTYRTLSQLSFIVSRYDNNADIRCGGDNIVMRKANDEPLQESFNMTVFYAPYVEIQIDLLKVNESDSFQVSCDYDAYPDVLLSDIKWMQNDSVLKLNNSRFSVVKQKQSRFNGDEQTQTALIVLNSTRNDSGSYNCQLSNKAGNGTSESQTFVDIQYKPTVAMRFDPSSPIFENDFVDVTLHCDIVDGNPSKLLRVQWMFNGNLLNETLECNDDFPDEDCSIDPNEFVVQNISRDQLGNYSCRGSNAAGWGDESQVKLLDVYYEPGETKVSFEPRFPIKGDKMNLLCSIEDLGNPAEIKFHWMQDGESIDGIETSEWTIDSVGLDVRANYSCYASNIGGNGASSSLQSDFYVAPKFIQKLPKYSGILYSQPNIKLSCRVECVPYCGIHWYHDRVEILHTNDKYFIAEMIFPANPLTGEFESTLSELHFNISTWPNQQLDRLKEELDEYTCRSSRNAVGTSVNSSTLFQVEYPPENITITPEDSIQVFEGRTPKNFHCNATAFPPPKIQWKHLDTDEILAASEHLRFSKGISRTDNGVFSCIADNRHGIEVANLTIDVLYSPSCVITRKQDDNKNLLICEAFGNPHDYKFEWRLKIDNETDKLFDVEDCDSKSYLRFGHTQQDRIYVCRASNTVGFGTVCEIIVEGELVWCQKLWPLSPLNIVAIIVGGFVAIVLLLCLVFCVFRRGRHSKMSERQK